jgi:hypothetical protein
MSLTMSDAQSAKPSESLIVDGALLPDLDTDRYVNPGDRLETIRHVMPNMTFIERGLPHSKR